MSRIVQITGSYHSFSAVCGSVFAQVRSLGARLGQRASCSCPVPSAHAVHFYGDKCLPCETPRTTRLQPRGVIKTLNKYFICVRINATQDIQVAAQFKVHSWPTDVFVFTRWRNALPRCFETRRCRIQDVLQSVAVMNRDRNSLIASQGKQTTAPNQFAGQQIQSSPHPK